MAAIVVENVYMEFPIYGSHRSFRKTFFARATGGLIKHGAERQDRVSVKALDDVSVTLKAAIDLVSSATTGPASDTFESYGLGVYEPTSGRVLASGKITPLFDVMPGLDWEDTGYENIITAGLLLGMELQEIDAKVADIEQFSELGEYLTLPVRTYSAGMITRLGFALARAVEPGILLMDEGIAAGDKRFADRAAKRMREFVDRSKILVLAGHTEDLIRSWCNRAVLFNAGKIVQVGRSTMSSRPITQWPAPTEPEDYRRSLLGASCTIAQRRLWRHST